MRQLNGNEQQCYEDMRLILQSRDEIDLSQLANLMRDQDAQYFRPDIGRMWSIINSKSPQGLSEGKPTYTDFIIAQIRLLTRAHKVSNMQIQHLCDSFFKNMSTPWFAVAKKSITFASFALIFLPAEVFAAIDDSPIELSETAKSLASCRVDITKYPPQFIRMKREYLQQLFLDGFDSRGHHCISKGNTQLGEEYSIYCDGLFASIFQDNIVQRIHKLMSEGGESQVSAEPSSLIIDQKGLFAAEDINIGDLIFFRDAELGAANRLSADDVELTAGLQLHPDEGAVWRAMNHSLSPTHAIVTVVITPRDDQAILIREAFIAITKSPPGRELLFCYAQKSYLNHWDQQVVDRSTIEKLKSIYDIRPSYIVDCRSTDQLPRPDTLQPTHIDHLLLKNPIFCLYLFAKYVIDLQTFKMSCQDNLMSEGLNPALLWLCNIIDDDAQIVKIRDDLIANNLVCMVESITDHQAGKTLEDAYSLIYYLFGERIDAEAYSLLRSYIARYKEIDLEKNPEKSELIEKHYEPINAVYNSKTIDRRQVVDSVCSALMQRSSATSVDQWLGSASNLQQHTNTSAWVRQEIMSRLTIFNPPPKDKVKKGKSSLFARAIAR
jgi:hypothetical protein